MTETLADVREYCKKMVGIYVGIMGDYQKDQQQLKEKSRQLGI